MIAKTTSSRPSEIIGIEDKWAAYQFDSAVCTVGLAIESAAQERENTGSKENPQWTNKYTMRELLDPSFKLPSEDSWGIEEVLMSVDGISYDEVK